MKSAATAIIGLTMLASSLGCAICDSSLDNDYASFGGVIQRTDPQFGRVGSSSYPASAPVGALGSLTPAASESSAADRPRDLQPNNTLDDGSSVEPPAPSENAPPNSGIPSGQSVDEMLESIPDLDEQMYQDLLDEIPSDDSPSEFPGEVNATPIKNYVESDVTVQPATFLTESSSNDNHVSLEEPASSKTILEQLGGAIVGE